MLGFLPFSGDDLPDIANVLESDTVMGIAGTYHEATVGEVVSGVNFGAGSALAGTYPTTATSQAAQLATDQATVLAAAASIKDNATILGQAGTYDFTTAITAGYASGEAAQLAADRFAINAVAASISDTVTGLLGTVDGTLDLDLYTLIAGVVAAGNVRSGTARYTGGPNGTAAIPAAADVQFGVAVDATTGTFAVPVVTDVRDGVFYGAAAEFEGTLVVGGGGGGGSIFGSGVIVPMAGAL